MKKCFYLAALALVAFSSCTSDDEVSNQEAVSDNGLERVVLGIGNPAMTVTTRGTGTIGSNVADENRWHYEHLRVLMTNTNEAASVFGFTTIDGLGDQFNNAFYCVPNEMDGTTENGQGISLIPKPKDNKDRFYPMSGYSNFFAYYIDDAVVAGDELVATTATQTGDVAPKIDNTTDPTKMVVNFQMDGTQDIMAGMAAQPTINTRRYYGFSAETSRKGAIPQIVMNHLLTRLTFTYVPGHYTAQGMIINKIEIETPYKGKLLVAYQANEPEDAANLITWDANNETAFFPLKQHAATWYTDAANGEGSKEALVDFSEVTIPDMESTYVYDPSAVGTRLGEAMFVKPGLTVYKGKMTVKYPYVEDAVTKYNTVVEPFEIKLPVDPNTNEPVAFQQGTSYNVKFVMYGYKKPEIQVNLTAWGTGETITLFEDYIEPTPAP